MMNAQTLLLVLLNFAGIGVLTATVFRRAVTVNARWLATALPHVACPVFLAVAYLLDLTSFAPDGSRTTLDLIATVLCAASIALMFLALGAHRTRLNHFHQADDAPENIVTHGAYSRIRHPFYTSYFLLYLAAVAVFPHPVTMVFFVYMLVVLSLTAAGEEQRLSASAFGSEYGRYITRTGRFLPRLRVQSTD